MGVEADAVSSHMIHALNRMRGRVQYCTVQQVSRLCSEDGVEGELKQKSGSCNEYNRVVGDLQRALREHAVNKIG